MFKSYLNKFQSGVEIISSIILIISCIHNFLNSSENVCKLVPCKDEANTVVKSMFSRSIAIACFISRIVVMYKSLDDMPKYKSNLDEYELYIPINIYRKKYYRLFTIIVTFAYIIIILPINVIRIYLMYYNFSDIHICLFQTMMYVQNMSICWTEIFFIIRCFGLYQHFQLINEEIAVVQSRTIIANNYPVALQSVKKSNQTICPESNVDFYHSGINVHQVANRIEFLRMRHQFVRNLVGKLNNLYGIQLGLSLCVLFVMSIFDIYGEISNTSQTRSKILIYGWMLQYVLRFYAIIMTTHSTTKQVRIFLFYHNVVS